jgi:hypothetical protein
MAGNVLQLGEVADFERQMFDLAKMFIRNPKLDLSTEPAILPNCCYAFGLFINELNFEIWTVK